jgi:hypothetical protein
MMLHNTTFGYLKPTSTQTAAMDVCRLAALEYAHKLDQHVPDGPDKTYLLRKLREVAMWANVAIARNPDGSPRGVDHPMAT